MRYFVFRDQSGRRSHVRSIAGRRQAKERHEASTRSTTERYRTTDSDMREITQELGMLKAKLRQVEKRLQRSLVKRKRKQVWEDTVSERLSKPLGIHELMALSATEDVSLMSVGDVLAQYACGADGVLSCGIRARVTPSRMPWHTADEQAKVRRKRRREIVDERRAAGKIARVVRRRLQY